MRRLIIITIIVLQMAFLNGCTAKHNGNTDNNIIVDNSTIEDEHITTNINSLSKIITDNRSEDLNKTHPVVTSKDDQMAEAVYEILNIHDEDMKKYAISISPMNLEAYCIAIIKPQTENEREIMNALMYYKQKQIDYYNNYLKEQHNIALNAVLTSVDDYILFVMSNDSKILIEDIKTALSKLKYELDY